MSHSVVLCLVLTACSQGGQTTVRSAMPPIPGQSRPTAACDPIMTHHSIVRVESGIDARSSHFGSDFRGCVDDSVLSIADGSIVSVTESLGDNGNGTAVFIRHVVPGSRMVIYVIYGHLSDVALQKGDPVEAGQTIGRMWRPSDDRRWTPHVHLQWLDSARSAEDRDPLELLGGCSSNGKQLQYPVRC